MYNNGTICVSTAEPYSISGKHLRTCRQSEPEESAAVTGRGHTLKRGSSALGARCPFYHLFEHNTSKVMDHLTQVIKNQRCYHF